MLWNFKELHNPWSFRDASEMFLASIQGDVYLYFYEFDIIYKYNIVRISLRLKKVFKVGS